MKNLYIKDERGASVVEFAIIVTVLFMLIFGLIEFGILMFDEQVLTNASREGARAGIIMRVPRMSDQEIEDVVNKYAQEHMVSFNPSAILTTTVTPDEASRNGITFGKELVVSVDYPFNFMVLSIFGFGPIDLKAETRMRME